MATDVNVFLNHLLVKCWGANDLKRGHCVEVYFLEVHNATFNLKLQRQTNTQIQHGALTSINYLVNGEILQTNKKAPHRTKKAPY